MASTEVLSRPSDPGADEFEYRPLSMAAIASLVFGLVSSLTIVAAQTSPAQCLMMCPIPLVGIFLGVTSLSRIRQMPNQLSGKGLAVAGLTLSLVGLIAGVGYASIIYATEVPEGYHRTSFEEMRPDEVERRGNNLIPRDIQQLDGKKVFIKGYMRADSTPRRHNVNKFLLVRDDESCCFGDLSSVQFFDQILVTTVGKLTTDYSTGIFRTGGTLRINPENLGLGVGHPVYELEADHLE